jgi:hypothetical protein
VWQGSAGDRRPYADHVALSSIGVPAGDFDVPVSAIAVLCPARRARFIKCWLFCAGKKLFKSSQLNQGV